MMLAISSEVTPKPNDIPSRVKRKNSSEMNPMMSNSFNPSKITPARILFFVADGVRIHLMPMLKRRKFTPINNPPKRSALGSSICAITERPTSANRSKPWHNSMRITGTSV
jgi:hypothetical protein